MRLSGSSRLLVVLFAAGAMFWIAIWVSNGFVRLFYYKWTWTDALLVVNTGHGGVSVFYAPNRQPNLKLNRRGIYRAIDGQTTFEMPNWSQLGELKPEGWMVELPYWLFVFPSAALLCCAVWSRWVVVWRPERRRRAGLCIFCGYDARATIGRCPECGAIAENRNPMPRAARP